ncbi:MAG: S8 family serine peptidase [Oligoflexus sp.]
MKSFALAFVGSLVATMASPSLAKPKTYNLDWEHVPNQLIVSFESEVPAEIKSLVSRKLGEFGSSHMPSLQSTGGTYLLEAHGPRKEGSLKELAEYIANLPGVRFVEANNIYRLQERIPDDQFFDRLYALKNARNSDSLNTRDINATFAWDITTGSKDVVVGVLDTGIDYRHPDLVDNYWFNPGESGNDEAEANKNSNSQDDDGNGYVDDWRGWNAYANNNDPMDGHGHGTHVAGTIGAKGNNGIGVVGVNWDVSLVAVKIFSDSGLTDTAAIVTGIDYSTAIGVDVTNNSWGGGAASEAIYEAIARANDAGILFVAAAGNSSSDNDSYPHYPSSYDLPNIIAVASTDRNDQLSGFSSYGATSVHIAAPGSDIFSTEPNNSYGLKSGTSMATPHVVGLVALVKSHFTELSYLQIKDRILSTSIRLPSLEGVVRHGRIDALSALEIDEVPPSDPSGLQIESSSLRSLQVSWQASGDDGDEGQATRYEIRMAKEPITAETWELAENLSYTGLSSAEARVKAELSDLGFNASGYLAIKAYDNVGNASGISESIAFELPPVVTLFENLGDVKVGFETAEKSWGSTELDGRLIISDSPDAQYENNTNASLTSAAFTVENTDLVLELKTRYELENSYDFGYVEIQVDGGDWQSLATLNGNSDWVSLYFDLKSYLTGAESYRFRFRITTDSSVTRQGWDIDEIRLIGAGHR